MQNVNMQNLDQVCIFLQQSLLFTTQMGSRSSKATVPTSVHSENLTNLISFKDPNSNATTLSQVFNAGDASILKCFLDTTYNYGTKEEIATLFEQPFYHYLIFAAISQPKHIESFINVLKPYQNRLPLATKQFSFEAMSYTSYLYKLLLQVDKYTENVFTLKNVSALGFLMHVNATIIPTTSYCFTKEDQKKACRLLAEFIQSQDVQVEGEEKQLLSAENVNPEPQPPGYKP